MASVFQRNEIKVVEIIHDTECVNWVNSFISLIEIDPHSFLFLYQQDL